MSYARIGGYVIEGNVPAADITQHLKERLDIAGLLSPGNSPGAPGLESPGAQT